MDLPRPQYCAIVALETTWRPLPVCPARECDRRGRFRRGSIRRRLSARAVRRARGVMVVFVSDRRADSSLICCGGSRSCAGVRSRSAAAVPIVRLRSASACTSADVIRPPSPLPVSASSDTFICRERRRAAGPAAGGGPLAGRTGSVCVATSSLATRWPITCPTRTVSPGCGASGGIRNSPSSSDSIS